MHIFNNVFTLCIFSATFFKLCVLNHISYVIHNFQVHLYVVDIFRNLYIFKHDFYVVYFLCTFFALCTIFTLCIFSFSTVLTSPPYSIMVMSLALTKGEAFCEWVIVRNLILLYQSISHLFLYFSDWSWNFFQYPSKFLFLRYSWQVLIIYKKVHYLKKLWIVLTLLLYFFYFPSGISSIFLFMIIIRIKKIIC